MYSIHKFDKNIGIITMIRDSDNKLVDIDVHIYNDYRRVSSRHYIELNTGEIVINNLPTRVFMGSADNMYRRATQWELDRWHTITDEHKNTHNAIVYNLIMNA